MNVNGHLEKYDNRMVTSLLFVALLIGAAAATGLVSIVLLALIVSTITAFYFPVVIPVTVLLLAPLLGRIEESIFGNLGGMELLALWFLALGGLIILFNLDKILRERLIILLILLVGVAIFSVPRSVLKMKSLTEVIRITSSFIMLPLVLLMGQQIRNRKIIIASIFLSSLIPLSVGMYQKLTGDISHEMHETLWEVQSNLLRIYSTFWDIHPYAKYLMIVLPLFLLFVFTKSKFPFYRITIIYLFSITLLELIFTYARSELVGFMLALVAILYAMDKIKMKSLFSLLPLFLVLMVIFYITGIFDRFADLFQALDLHSGVRENSLKSRLILWIRGFPLAIQTPLLGHGADTFDETMGMVSHNDYLGLFYDIGIGGPILYILFLFFALRKTLKLSRFRDIESFDRNVIIAAVGNTFSIAVVSFVENLFKATVMWWFYFAILGCALAAFGPTNPPEQKIDKKTIAP